MIRAIAERMGWIEFRAFVWVRRVGAPSTSVEEFMLWKAVHDAKKKEARRAAQRERDKEYTLSGKAAAKRRERYQKDSKKMRDAAERWRLSPQGRAKVSATRCARYSVRISEDPEFKIKSRLRTRIRNAMRFAGADKNAPTAKLVGCSMLELRGHLEKLWKHGMSWNNYGKKGWHIDHIRPCDSFDLTDPEQQAACFHFTNMQPLWWRENIIKGAKLQQTFNKHSGR